MKLKLSATNPYLRDPLKRERALFESAVSSSAIEGIRVPLKGLRNGPGKLDGPKARIKS